MAALALIVAGCSSSEDNLPVDLTDTPIKVNASVDPLLTRAGYAADALPSKFYLTITSQNQNYCYDVEMRSEIVDKATTWQSYVKGTTDTKKLMLWADNNQVAVKASTFEISDNAVTLTANPDQTVEDNLKKSDHLMWDNAEQAADPKGINVEFSHIMAKLNINVKLGNQYNGAESPITGITLGGTKTSASFSRTAGWTVDANAAADDVKAFDTKVFTAVDASKDVKNATAKFEAILVPQTMDKGKFSVTIVINNGTEDKTYVWTSDKELKMDKGTCYDVNITAGKDKVESVTFTQTAWTEEQEASLETE